MLKGSSGCPDCGQPLPEGAGGGGCPFCLLRLGILSGGPDPNLEGISVDLAEEPAEASITPVISFGESSQRIGRYRLLEVLGEGGFGTVWMAEQQEPMRRRVALKILKAGMDTREVVARFEAERQALALMDHPNIAHVFDGGTTDSGRPYFVMELVRGQRITEYCDTQHLETGARLELFVTVCQAVQHAHQKGIIHRDLKPSNVLVTEQDGRPVPKVIDFGIAKATQCRLTEHTVFTRLHQVIGTPAYMSPEQAGLGGLDIDTRSDIYSLGVLLYELLTGKTPFSNDEMLQAGFEEMLRLLREQEPPKPSTRLATLREEERCSVALGHRMEAERLSRRVRGELDWIALKALEKDRARRYQSAAALAEDVARHLRDEPIQARPTPSWRRGMKWVRRRPAIAALLALAVLLLLGGATGIAWQAAATRRALKKTQEALGIASLKEAQALLGSRQPGQRLDTLKAVRVASAGRPSPELRDAAIAAMALPDLEEIGDWHPVPSSVEMVAVDAQLTRFATIQDRNKAVVQDFEDGHVIARIPESALSSYRPVLSPDGRQLCVQGETAVQLWDLDRTNLVARIPGRGTYAFNPDGTRLACKLAGVGVNIVDTRVGAELVRYEEPAVRAGFARFDPTGRLLAADLDEEIVIWDAETLRVEERFSRKSGPLWSVSWHPQGDRLLVTDLRWEIYLWQRGKQNTSTLGRQELGRIQAWFHPAGDWWITTGGDRALHLWSLATQRPVLETSRWLPIQFNQDGTLLAVRRQGAVGRVKVHRPRECQLMAANFLTQDRNTSFDLSPDGRRWVSQHYKSIRLSDFSRTEADHGVAAPEVTDVRFLGPDRLVGIGQRGVQTWPLLRGTGGSVLGRSTRIPTPITGFDNLMAVSPDGSRVAAFAGSTGLVIRVDGRQPPVWLAERRRVYGPVFSPDGRWLATGTPAGRPGVLAQACLWSSETGELLKAFPAGSAQVVFGPQGDWLMLGRIHEYEQYDTRNWTVVRSYPRSTSADWGGAAAFSPDGRWLALQLRDGEVQLRDARSGTRLASFKSPAGRTATRIQFDPSGRRLAVWSPNLLEWWDIDRVRQGLDDLGLNWIDPNP